MFFYSYKLLFITILMLSTLISISSNNWLSSWMGLEINLLSFIPLMNDSNNLMSTESSLKYFLIQVLASSTLLFSIIMYMYYYHNNEFFFNNYINLNLMASLMMKMGMAPFHFWLPNMIEGLNWYNTFMILTWQKIAPMMLMSYLTLNFLIIPIILSMIIGSIGGLNQISVRKIMAYSSINHLGWMGMALFLNNILWLNYFIIYSILSFNLIFYFNTNKMFFINQLFMNNYFSNELKMILFLNLLSFGGLPPFLGFYPKWKIIEFASSLNSFITIMMVMITLVTLYYYTRLCYSSFMLSYYEQKYHLKIKTNFLYLILSFFSIFGLLMINLLFYML